MTTKKHILNTIQLHKEKLNQVGVLRIGLLGSYARDEQSDQSDIDILIEFAPKKENSDNYMAAYDYIEQLFKNNKVEIVTKNGLSPYFGPQILREVVYV